MFGSRGVFACPRASRSQSRRHCARPEGARAVSAATVTKRPRHGMRPNLTAKRPPCHVSAFTCPSCCPSGTELARRTSGVCTVNASCSCGLPIATLPLHQVPMRLRHPRRARGRTRSQRAAWHRSGEARPCPCARSTARWSGLCAAHHIMLRRV